MISKHANFFLQIFIFAWEVSEIWLILTQNDPIVAYNIVHTELLKNSNYL